MTAVRVHLILAMLASLWACRRFGDGECCRQHGVTFRRAETGALEVKGTGFLAKDDALTIMAYPGWHKRLTRFDSDTLRELSPIMDALDRSLLSHLEPNRNDRHRGLYGALGQLLTQDPAVAAAALDGDSPIMVKIRPAGRQTVAVFMQIMPIPGAELPQPDLLARVVVPSKDPTATLAHLKRALAKENSCLSEPPAGYSAICELARQGFVGFSIHERAIQVDLVSDHESALRDRLPWYLQVLKPAPEFAPAETQSAAAEMSRNRAALTVIIPGGQVAPLGQVFNLSDWWTFILGCATGRPFPGMQYELPLRGRSFIPAYMLSLPAHLELQNFRVTVVLEDSIRIIADAEMTDHGAELLVSGFALASGESNARPDRFVIDRVLASVEPMADLYDDDVERKPVLAFSSSGVTLLQYLLQSPMLVLKTLASTVPDDQGKTPPLAGILGKRLGFEGVTWRIASEGQGTVAHISARGPNEDLASVRVWLVSNRRLKAEACVLPNRLPCNWSKCSDEVVLEAEQRLPQGENNPCWEQALSGMHRMLAEMVSIPALRVEDSVAWFQHAIPLHHQLVCARRDADVADVAGDIDDALRRLVAQKGRLIPFDGKPGVEGRRRFFPEPPQPKRTR